MKKGIYLALAAAAISGWAVFINKFALTNWGSSEVYTTEKNIIAAILLSALVLGSVLRKNILSLTLIKWVKLLVIGLIGGSIPFILFFKGLQIGDSAGVAFWNKTIFIWVALLAWPILKEKLGKTQVVAFSVLILGNLALFCPLKLTFDFSSILIIAATLFWALEYILVKKFIMDIPSPVAAWGRMFFGSIFLILYLLASQKSVMIFNISVVQLPWLMIVGLTLFGYVLTWYGALKRIPATLAASILVIASPITTLLNSIYGSAKLTGGFWGLFIALTVSIYLLIKFNRNKDLDNKTKNSTC